MATFVEYHKEVGADNAPIGLKDFAKGTPQFCIIAPTPYLERYAVKSHTHLVLAHIVDKDPAYAAFYRRMSARGDRIIMDNGAFELGESYNPERLIDLGNECGADAIVLPDYPFEPAAKTIDAAEQWADRVHEAGFKTMFVPQSKTGDLEDWIECYDWASLNEAIDIIGMSILGIPNALPHIPAAYARVVMTQILKDRSVLNIDKFHHYLGLNAGPALEIPALITMGALDSCDSSGPVWAGVCGHRYTVDADSYQSVRKVKKHVDFDYPLVTDKDTLDRIDCNVDLTLSLFK